MTSLIAALTPLLGGLAALLVVLKLFFFGTVAAPDLGIDFDSFGAMMKETYSGKKVAELIYKKNKFLARVPRNTGFQGESKSIGLKFGNPTGVGRNFSTTKGNKQPGKYGKFVIEPKELFGFVRMNHRLIKQTKGDAGSLLRAKGEEFDGMFQQMGRRQAIQLWRNGGGTLGQVDGAVNTDVITLSKLSDVRNFEVGMILTLHSAEKGGATRAGGPTEVIAVDRSAGTITLDDDLNTSFAAAADGDWFAVEGDYDEAITGVAAYIPATAAEAVTPLKGLDRSKDPTRLAGLRLDLTGWGYEEAVIELLSAVSNEGGTPNAVYMNPIDWVALERALGSRKEYVSTGSTVAEIGFSGLRVVTEDGEAVILSDINVPSGLMYALQEDTWCLESVGETPALWDEDGNMSLRATDSNDIDVQAYGYHELSCSAPGYNGVAQIG